mmetsp:Transcript_9111/g.14510  ORF Transcript_9111/g.14510 Transcript_9111/m.14510 type:complete len:512 (+) Transcript_9111:34-1569(+)
MNAVPGEHPLTVPSKRLLNVKGTEPEQKTVDALAKAMNILDIATRGDIQHILKKVVDIERQVVQYRDDLLRELSDLKRWKVQTSRREDHRSDRSVKLLDRHCAAQTEDIPTRHAIRQKNSAPLDLNAQQSERIDDIRPLSASSDNSVIFLSGGHSMGDDNSREDGVAGSEDKEEDVYLEDSESGSLPSITNLYEEGEEEDEHWSSGDDVEPSDVDLPCARDSDTVVRPVAEVYRRPGTDRESVARKENHIDDLTHLKLFEPDRPRKSKDENQHRSHGRPHPIDVILESLRGFWYDSSGSYQFVKRGLEWFCEKRTSRDLKHFQLTYNIEHSCVMWGFKYYMDGNWRKDKLVWRFAETPQMNQIAFTWHRQGVEGRDSMTRTMSEPPVRMASLAKQRSPVGSALSDKQGWPSQPRASRNAKGDQTVESLEIELFPSLHGANQISEARTYSTKKKKFEEWAKQEELKKVGASENSKRLESVEMRSSRRANVAEVSNSMSESQRRKTQDAHKTV